MASKTYLDDEIGRVNSVLGVSNRLAPSKKNDPINSGNHDAISHGLDKTTSKYSQAVEEDAKKLLTHAFQQKSGYKQLENCIFRNNVMLNVNNESNDISYSSTDDMLRQCDKSENLNYMWPIAEIQLPKNCCLHYDNIGMSPNASNTGHCNKSSDSSNSFAISNLKSPPSNELCDICCNNQSLKYIGYNELTDINCCRLDVFNSVAISLEDTDCCSIFDRSVLSKKIKKSTMDRMVTKFHPTSNHLSNDSSLKDICKKIWRLSYHEKATSSENASLCDKIEKKVCLCRKLLRYLLSAIENIFKVLPGTKRPSVPNYDSRVNPIPYTIFPQLSKLYARFLSVMFDVEYIIMSLDSQYHAMLPTFLKSNFSGWCAQWSKFDIFIKNYVTCSQEASNIRQIKELNKQLFQEHDTIDLHNAKNFHYCDHFSSQQELNDLLCHIDSAYDNLLYGPFILNFCVLIYQKKIPPFQLETFGFDSKFIPRYLWDHPFESLFQNMDFIISQLGPHQVDR